MSARIWPVKSPLSTKLGYGVALAGVSAMLFIGLFGAVAVSSASAAAVKFTAPFTLLGPPTQASDLPDSLTGCSGHFSRDSQGDNWYDYSFSCAANVPGSEATGDIIEYSLTATRQNIDGIEFDQNNVLGNGSPTVYSAGTVLSDETVTCNTAAPSDGFDCDSGLVAGSAASGTAPTVNQPCESPTAGVTYTNLGCIPSGDQVEGQFQLSASYCSYLPKGKSVKAGTPAVPRATVDLLVADDSGAMDGPFELTPSFKCPKVAATVPASKKKTKKTKKKSTAKRSAAKKS